MLEKEELYDVLVNSQNEIMFSIKARDGEPVSPKLIYDGAEHALFYRKSPKPESPQNPPERVLLDFIDESIRPLLQQKQNVLFMEVDYESETVLRAYKVSVLNVSKLPVPEADLPKL